jgi:hypothetical protein
MAELSIYKAQPAIRGEEVDSLVIRIERCLPEVPPIKDEAVDSYLERASENFARDARELAAHLRKTLPGGTFDCLLGEMLKIKASHFRVTF